MPDTAAAMHALASGDIRALSPLLIQRAGGSRIERIPEIGRVKERLLSAGAMAASMSGSGSAVFGVFADQSAAEAALPALSDLPFARVCESN